MIDWLENLLACRRRSEAAVLICVAACRGSVPRDAGTRMVVTGSNQYGTIGGGHLELEAIGIARRMLVDGERAVLRRFPLAATLGQCCGGVVDLIFESVAPRAAETSWIDAVGRCSARGEACILVSEAGSQAAGGTLVVSAHGCSGSLGADAWNAAAHAIAQEMLASDSGTRLAELGLPGPTFLFAPLRVPELDVVLFGAGHVGQALARILGDLPCRVAWIDERVDRFPAIAPPNIEMEVSDTPVAEVQAARPGACYLVMTHSHALDLSLAEAILRRGDFRYFGLIGSLAKRRRFERRLEMHGIPPEGLARMTCPIGIGGIEGKSPAVIAVAVAAQLLLLADPVHDGLHRPGVLGDEVGKLRGVLIEDR